MALRSRGTYVSSSRRSGWITGVSSLALQSERQCCMKTVCRSWIRSMSSRELVDDLPRRWPQVCGNRRGLPHQIHEPSLWCRFTARGMSPSARDPRSFRCRRARVLPDSHAVKLGDYSSLRRGSRDRMGPALRIHAPTRGARRYVPSREMLRPLVADARQSTRRRSRRPSRRSSRIERRRERRLEHLGWATIITTRSRSRRGYWSPSGSRPCRWAGSLHQVGLPWHWGPNGYTTGDAANELRTCRSIRTCTSRRSRRWPATSAPGRRPRGPALREFVRAYQERAGITDTTGTEM